MRQLASGNRSCWNRLLGGPGSPSPKINGNSTLGTSVNPSTPHLPPVGTSATCWSQMDPCQTHQFWLEDPWTRPPCQWNDRCSRLHATYTGPGEPELLRTNIALQTENSQIKRVRAYAAEVLGAGGLATDTGIARSGTSR